MSAGGFGDACAPTAELVALVAACKDKVNTFLQGAGWNGIITEFTAISVKQQALPTFLIAATPVLSLAHGRSSCALGCGRNELHREGKDWR